MSTKVISDLSGADLKEDAYRLTWVHWYKWPAISPRNDKSSTNKLKTKHCKATNDKTPKKQPSWESSWQVIYWTIQNRNSRTTSKRQERGERDQAH